ncbi:MAG TPA: DUF6797 domain-containing protein [Verrucomicrobiae bacterium]
MERRQLIAAVMGAALATTSVLAQTPPAPKAPEKKAEAKPAKPEVTTTKWDAMDVGPFFSGYLITQPVNGKTQSGQMLALKTLSIKLAADNKASAAFDTQLMRMAYAWTDGFIKLPVKRDGLEGFPEVIGNTVFATQRIPGWADAKGSFTDPRERYEGQGEPVGAMPHNWLKWRGHYLNGDKVVLSYLVNGAGVLEHPSAEFSNGQTVITRTFSMDATKNENVLFLFDAPHTAPKIEGNKITLTTQDGGAAIIASLSGNSAGKFERTPEGKVLLRLPAGKAVDFKVSIWSGATANAAAANSALQAAGKLADVKALTKAGPARWTTPVTTQGKLGKDEGPYVTDTITVPEDNPWKSWIRCSGFDFFSDGRAAVSSVSGDVWIVSGIDAKLDKLTWKRFATGLFQPLGLKIVKDQVYVLGRDQITRFTDSNKDGEADFYENFNNDVSISSHYHEFCLNLETDSAGNFYFIKGGNLGPAKIPHHGTMNRVSKDGSKLEVVATGHRAPNGMSVGPKDQLTSSDNEGNWVPASRVNWVVPGGFYGHVFTAHRSPAPTDYDRPLFWLPHQMDNSSGGQIWVTSEKWGPFKNDMLHTSYGKCSLFKVMYEEVDGQMQGAVVRFPLNFDSGIMRGHFSPFDGQLYMAGLRVWQSSGAREGAFHRVRYTGKAVNMPKELHVKPNGIEITFTNPLDAELAKDPENYALDQWNYKWAQEYGSKMYSVADSTKTLGDKGQSTFKGEDVKISAVKLSNGNKTVFLEFSNVQPVMQYRIRYNLDSADGDLVRQEIYGTINKVPKS